VRAAAVTGITHRSHRSGARRCRAANARAGRPRRRSATSRSSRARSSPQPVAPAGTRRTESVGAQALAKRIGERAGSEELDDDQNASDGAAAPGASSSRPATPRPPRAAHAGRPRDRSRSTGLEAALRAAAGRASAPQQSQGVGFTVGPRGGGWATRAAACPTVASMMARSGCSSRADVTSRRLGPSRTPPMSSSTSSSGSPAAARQHDSFTRSPGSGRVRQPAIRCPRSSNAFPAKSEHVELIAHDRRVDVGAERQVVPERSGEERALDAHVSVLAPCARRSPRATGAIRAAVQQCCLAGARRPVTRQCCPDDAQVEATVLASVTSRSRQQYL